MFFDHGCYMGGMHTFWWIFWLILVAVLVFAVWSPQRGSGRSGGESPRDILKRRLAKGEITPEAYEQTKALLERDSDRG